MKHNKLLAALLAVALLILGAAAAQEATIQTEVLDMTVDDFVAAYNTGITGLLELDRVKSYPVTDAAIAYPATQAQDVSLLLQLSGDQLRGVGIVFANGRADFAELLAIANRAIAVMAPDTTQEERYNALMELTAGGVVTGALANYKQNTVYCGAAKEYMLVYVVHENQSQILAMKGKLK